MRRLMNRSVSIHMRVREGTGDAFDAVKECHTPALVCDVRET